MHSGDSHTQLQVQKGPWGGLRVSAEAPFCPGAGFGEGEGNQSYFSPPDDMLSSSGRPDILLSSSVGGGGSDSDGHSAPLGQHVFQTDSLGACWKCL